MTPMPGPTSRTGMPGQASTVSAMSWAIFRSVKKCCPRNFLGFTLFIVLFLFYFCGRKDSANREQDKINLFIFQAKVQLVL